jgi:DNA binding domain, excisionase family
MPETTISGDILTIRQLADYLMVSEKTVYRMVEKNQLPAMRIGAQWRFRKNDIDAWLTDEVRRVEREGKRAVLDSLEASELAIHPLLSPSNVFIGVRPHSRDELLSIMISAASLDAHVDREHLLRSVRERESLCSTALVEHALFPHPVDPAPFRFSKKCVILAVLAEPLEVGNPHGHRPRLAAMILARSMQGHLLALSRAIKLFGDRALIERVTAASGAADVIAAVSDAEALLDVRSRA